MAALRRRSARLLATAHPLPGFRGLSRTPDERCGGPALDHALELCDEVTGLPLGEAGHVSHLRRGAELLLALTKERGAVGDGLLAGGALRPLPIEGKAAGIGEAALEEAELDRVPTVRGNDSVEAHPAAVSGDHVAVL